MRLESGLSFIEFNYMLLQGVRFPRALPAPRLHAPSSAGTTSGGTSSQAPTSSGGSRGPTARRSPSPCSRPRRAPRWGRRRRERSGSTGGATSPYDYYQYWINADDRDVGASSRSSPSFRWTSAASRLLPGERLREAKETLAYEATKLNHGEAEPPRPRKGPAPASLALAGLGLAVIQLRPLSYASVSLASRRRSPGSEPRRCTSSSKGR